MTLEAILYIMDEEPERILIHICTADNQHQFTYNTCSTFNLPYFIKKQRVEKFYYNDELKELEVML